jgi:hypothetical protein
VVVGSGGQTGLRVVVVGGTVVEPGPTVVVVVVVQLGCAATFTVFGTHCVCVHSPSKLPQYDGCKHKQPGASVVVGGGVVEPGPRVVVVVMHGPQVTSHGHDVVVVVVVGVLVVVGAGVLVVGGALVVTRLQPLLASVHV